MFGAIVLIGLKASHFHSIPLLIVVVVAAAAATVPPLALMVTPAANPTQSSALHTGCPCRFFSGPTNVQPYHIDCDDGFDGDSSGDELSYDEDSLVSELDNSNYSEEDFILDSK